MLSLFQKVSDHYWPTDFTFGMVYGEVKVEHVSTSRSDGNICNKVNLTKVKETLIVTHIKDVRQMNSFKAMLS